MKKLMNWALALTAVFAVACDDDDNKSSIHETDRTFMKEAAMTSRSEIELGQIAAGMGASADVKAYGALMEKDHKAVLNELEIIAKDENVSLPYVMDSKRLELRAKLTALTGHAFDSAYLSSQVTAHQEVITLFENEAASGQEARIKDYANKYLPALRLHLHKADSLFQVIEQ